MGGMKKKCAKGYRVASRPVQLFPESNQDETKDLQDFVEDVLKENTPPEGEARIKIPDLIELFEISKGLRYQSPIDHYVVSNQFEGNAGDETAKVACEFKIDVIGAGWISAPLLSTDVAVDDIKISFEPKNKDDSANEHHVMAMPDKQFTLVCKGKGIYTVQMVARVKYLSQRARSVSFAVPCAVSNHIQWNIPEPGLEVKVEPSLLATHTHTDDATKVEAVMSPSRKVTVEWSEKEVEVELEEQVEPTPVETVCTAESLTVHGIGEGMVKSHLELRFKVLSGSKSVFDVAVPKKARVIGATGASLKRWDVLNASIDSEDRVIQDDEKILRVYLHREVDTRYILNVNYECDMPGTSGEVSLPVTRALKTDRETGHIGVAARTSVEVSEVKVVGAARVGVSEAQPTLCRLADNPLLFAYKYLQPPNQLVVNVKKHSDVGVLIATCDKAYFMASFAEDRVLYKLTLMVRNTQKQYLRMKLPESAEIWSSQVGNKAVKPAFDTDTKEVMLPLTKGEGASCAFSVSIVYACPDQSTEQEMKVQFPSFDIPINQLFTSIYAREDNEFGEFTGMKEVENFSSVPPSAPRISTTPSFPSARLESVDSMSEDEESMFDEDLESVEQFQVQQVQNVNFERNLVPQSRGGSAMRNQISSSGGVGVTPVEVTVPITKKQFKFEKLVVINEEIHISAPCRVVKKSYFQRRRLGMSEKRKAGIISAAVAVGIVSVYLVARKFL
eukprot:TRINITY_DN42270_c0_g1_i1.p1 TRINITY_DN42270_c0_g1~~TRINITY_DN42270_c0_g1_i1.p1  ORF type:complete len:730 (+),score=225.57 TRINITY_DN42270_c0_g1_i1:28-2217(+)